MAKTKTAAKSATAKKKPASPKAKSAASPKRGKASTKAGEKAAAKSGAKTATIDRRRSARRTKADDAEQATAAAPKLERRKKVNRRRQIDPTTCERDYSDAEVQFMNALDDYKRQSGRMFPTCSEVLEVIRGLGYVQLSAAEIATRGDAIQEPAKGETVDATQHLDTEEDPVAAEEAPAELV